MVQIIRVPPGKHELVYHARSGTDLSALKDLDHEVGIDYLSVGGVELLESCTQSVRSRSITLMIDHLDDLDPAVPTVHGGVVAWCSRMIRYRILLPLSVATNPGSSLRIWDLCLACSVLCKIRCTIGTTAVFSLVLLRFFVPDPVSWHCFAPRLLVL